MMTVRTKLRIWFMYLLLLPVLSCTMTTTTRIDPDFRLSIDSLQTQLNGIVTCENINLVGTGISTNGKNPTSELEIAIKNGKNIPDDPDQNETLAKQIAIVVKSALNNQNQFDRYKVLFVVEKGEGSISKRTWKGKVFTSNEL